MILGALLVGGLSLAAVRGGAPTHHVGRPLVSVWLLLAVFVGARGWTLLRRADGSRRVLLIFAAALLVGLCVFRWRPFYAHMGQFAGRHDETLIGRAVGRVVAPGQRVLLEVTDYGFYAVLAGSGRPEVFVVDRGLDPRKPEEPSSFDSATQLSKKLGASGAAYAVGRPCPAAAALVDPPLAAAGAFRLWAWSNAADATPVVRDPRAP